MDISGSCSSARCVGPLALMLVLAGGFVSSKSIAQSGPPAENIPLLGTVRTSSGKPLASASVSLGRSADSSLVVGKTTAEGDFALSAPGAGAYTLTVTRPGFRTLVSRIELTGGNQKRLALVLKELPPADASHASSHPRVPDLEFADQPNFTVAGVTDASTVGGHGSTATLPITESLARETVELKSEPLTRPENHSSETELRAALARAPASFAANHDLGEFYLHSGKPQEAIPLLETAYRLDSRHYENAYELALAYERSGDLQRARRQVGELLEKESSAPAHRLLGDIDERLKEPVTAVKEYEQAVRLDPSEANYFAWGSELLLHRAIQPAIEVLSEGSKAFPGSARMLAGLGAALYAGGAVEAASERLCQASDLAPGDLAPHLFLGKIEQSVHRPLPCAEEKLARFRQKQPANPWAHYYYAVALTKRSPLAKPALAEKIQRLLQTAISIDPQFAEAFLQLGILEDERGNLKQAILDYQRAIRSKPALTEAHYRLARAYKQAGETEKARQEFESYGQIQRQDAAENERARRELQEFVVVLKQPASNPEDH